MLIRPHRRDDADRIAEILAAGWRQAYLGVRPDTLVLPRIDTAARKAEIAAWLDADFDPAIEAIFVAENDGAVVGFIHMEKGDKGELGASTIVDLLYVDPPEQNHGVGRALMAAGAGWAEANAPGKLVLSAFTDNRFRHAYAAMGGREAKHLTTQLDGSDIALVLYLWDDPTVPLR